MRFFNFHHHNASELCGIYNAEGVLPKNSLFSTGLNPMLITKDWNEKFQLVEVLANEKNCAAIGECGLDSRFGDEVLQREIFIKHLQLAERLQKPLIIHCVRRFPEIIYLTRDFTFPKIIHGFNKNLQTAKALLENGFYLSFGASILQNLSLQKIFIETPLSRLFLETDDDEVEIRSIYEKAAVLKEISIQNLQEEIEKNLKKNRHFIDSVK